MNRMHPPTRLRGRAALVLSSVLALLALACFPVAAQAEGSGEVEYNPTLPTPDGKKQPGSEKIAETSNDHGHGGGVTAPSGTPGPGHPGGSSGALSEGGGGRKAVGGGSGPSQGSPGGGHQGGGKPQAAAPASNEGGGASSPLVPVLIAVLVLAAISVGVVIARQRRRPSASPLSPKAG